MTTFCKDCGRQINSASGCLFCKLAKPLDKDRIVKIYRGVSGWHYHMPDCWMAQSPDYESFPLKEVLKMKTATGGKYQPCACMSGKPMPRWNKK